MRYTHMLAMAALVVATAFIGSEALAQWSDGGPEMYPLTYPSKESGIERESKTDDATVDRVQPFDALARWSDGGPEMYPLTYPPEAAATQIDSRVVAKECDLDRSFDALAQWSDGGPERYPLTYPSETAMMDGEICLAKESETSVTGPLTN